MNRFVISVDDSRVARLRKKDARLGVVFDLLGDIEFDDYSDGYSFIVCEIVGQMISWRVAEILCDRLKALCGGEICPRTISRFPTAELRSVGLSRPKCEYIQGFTEAILNEELVLEDLENVSDDEAMKRLTAIRGIGTWTAKMYLLCVLRRDDVFPQEDKQFVAACKWLYNKDETTRDDLKKLRERWSPYSSVATLYLYRAVSSGLTSNSFSEYAKSAKRRERGD